MNEKLVEYETRDELFDAIKLVLQDDIPKVAGVNDLAFLSCEAPVPLSFEMLPTKMPWRQAVQQACRLLQNEPGGAFQVIIHIGSTIWTFHRSGHYTGCGYILVQPTEPHA